MTMYRQTQSLLRSQVLSAVLKPATQPHEPTASSPYGLVDAISVLFLCTSSMLPSFVYTPWSQA